MIKNRMIILSIQAKQKDITQSGMVDFLNNQLKEFQNPITQEPFQWDGEYIYFVDATDKLIRHEVKH